jgi:hypothetical protein
MVKKDLERAKRSFTLKDWIKFIYLFIYF